MENSGELFVEIVKKYIGCSLSARRDELASLVARGVDDPAKTVLIKTNCGMFSLGVMWEAGVEHELVSQPYKLSMAISWLRQIGQDLGALNKYTPKNPPKLGALLHYYTKGKNDNHVEWLLSTVNSNNSAEHGGGGRSNNAITSSKGLITWNVGRPLQEWWDPEELLK
jgi:hypothetical protein